VYSGIVANGNGNSADSANLNATFLRGIQATDSEGFAAFSTIVPGHYTGRTTHIHVLAHAPGQWSLQANNTITGGATAAHVGQIFFDQDLLTEVASCPLTARPRRA
jgi:protocatechuate 3,4-dioxygenase beta subunit